MIATRFDMRQNMELCLDMAKDIGASVFYVKKQKERKVRKIEGNITLDNNIVMW